MYVFLSSETFNGLVLNNGLIFRTARIRPENIKLKYRGQLVHIGENGFKGISPTYPSVYSDGPDKI